MTGYGNIQRNLTTECCLCPTAPGQPPLNVEWTLIGSQITIYWEPVVAMETESEVTGYQVSSYYPQTYHLFPN